MHANNVLKQVHMYVHINIIYYYTYVHNKSSYIAAYIRIYVCTVMFVYLFDDIFNNY